jgi:hypothetical protein
MVIGCCILQNLDTTSHGLELEEKIDPACTEMPSLGSRSNWQIAHVNKLEVLLPSK